MGNPKDSDNEKVIVKCPHCDGEFVLKEPEDSYGQ